MIYHWEKDSEEFKISQHLSPGGELLEGSERELGLESSLLMILTLEQESTPMLNFGEQFIAVLAWAAITKKPKTAWLKQEKCVSYRAWELWDQGASPGWVPVRVLPGLEMASSCYVLARALVSCSSYQDTNPSWGEGGLPSWPYLNLTTSQRPHLLYHPTKGLGFQHKSFRRTQICGT